MHVSAVIVYATCIYMYRLVLPRSILSYAFAIFEEKTSWPNFRNLFRNCNTSFSILFHGGGELLGVVEGGRLKGDDDGRTFRMRKVLAKLFDRDSTVLWGGEY